MIIVGDYELETLSDVYDILYRTERIKLDFIIDMDDFTSYKVADTAMDLLSKKKFKDRKDLAKYITFHLIDDMNLNDFFRKWERTISAFWHDVDNTYFSDEV